MALETPSLSILALSNVKPWFFFCLVLKYYLILIHECTWFNSRIKQQPAIDVMDSILMPDFNHVLGVFGIGEWDLGLDLVSCPSKVNNLDFGQ